VNEWTQNTDTHVSSFRSRGFSDIALILPNLHTFITSFLFSVLVVLARHPSLLLLGHHLLKLLIVPFGMLHRVSGINSLYLFVNFILVPVPPVPTHPLLHLSLLPLLFHHSAHPQLPLSFTPGLKPTCFTNPIPVVPLLPPGLPSWTFACTVPSELIGFCFSFSLIFVSVPCARLNWPFVSFWAHVNIHIVSYRILLTTELSKSKKRQQKITVLYK